MNLAKKMARKMPVIASGVPKVQPISEAHAKSATNRMREEVSDNLLSKYKRDYIESSGYRGTFHYLKKDTLLGCTRFPRSNQH